MPKTTVSAGDGDVPDMHPVWGDVGPITALGHVQEQLKALKAELHDTQEKLHQSRRVAAVCAIKIDLLRAQLASN